MSRSILYNDFCCLVLLGAALQLSATAQSFTTLANFDSANGSTPFAPPVQALNGNFYGTTSDGGANGQGAVYEITPSGTLTTLYSFCSLAGCADGSHPQAGLVQSTNGDLYGTTVAGGANGNSGTIFKITLSGTLTTMYSFCAEAGCTDGYSPTGLIQATNGNFYGAATGGGANNGGTIFKVTPSGAFTTLYSFCAETGCSDGDFPSASLVQSTNGDLYGATLGGGVGNLGTVFKITPSGTLTTLHSFCAEAGCTDGANPNSGLVQAANGDLYGTTDGGGANDDGLYYLGGTVFKVTPEGMLTTVYSFCAETDCTDGENPSGSLVQAANNNFYGTTFGGGAVGAGAAFEITPRGLLTTLYNFCAESGCDDGVSPEGLVEATSGLLYGVTAYGGTANAGTIFRLSAGLSAFVETLPASGNVGATVKILGTDLTGATGVTFNRIAATFTVLSATEITTKVPDGATSGTVEVTTPAGTLSSNVKFRVNP